MREYVLVEFLVAFSEAGSLLEQLNALGDDFIHIKDDHEFETDTDTGTTEYWIRVTGKISSMQASVIKLQDSYLASRMRISYISEELKNKYRS
jgi:hypothetical protein